MDHESILKLIDRKLQPIYKKLEKLDDIENSISFYSESIADLEKKDLAKGTLMSRESSYGNSGKTFVSPFQTVFARLSSRFNV